MVFVYLDGVFFWFGDRIDLFLWFYLWWEGVVENRENDSGWEVNEISCECGCVVGMNGDGL